MNYEHLQRSADNNVTCFHTNCIAVSPSTPQLNIKSFRVIVCLCVCGESPLSIHQLSQPTASSASLYDTLWHWMKRKPQMGKFTSRNECLAHHSRNKDPPLFCAPPAMSPKVEMLARKFPFRDNEDVALLTWRCWMRMRLAVKGGRWQTGNVSLHMDAGTPSPLPSVLLIRDPLTSSLSYRRHGTETAPRSVCLTSTWSPFHYRSQLDMWR